MWQIGILLLFISSNAAFEITECPDVRLVEPLESIKGNFYVVRKHNFKHAGNDCVKASVDTKNGIRVIMMSMDSPSISEFLLKENDDKNGYKLVEYGAEDDHVYAFVAIDNKKNILIGCRKIEDGTISLKVAVFESSPEMDRDRIKAIDIHLAQYGIEYKQLKTKVNHDEKKCGSGAIMPLSTFTWIITVLLLGIVWWNL